MRKGMIIALSTLVGGVAGFVYIWLAVKSDPSIGGMAPFTILIGAILGATAGWFMARRGR
jgi:hypothetical protein